MNKPYIPVREIIFGLEDSLVSTSGVVVGIAVGTENRYLVILSAVVVIVVESLSMAAGTYLSNKSEMEVAHTTKGIARKPLIDSLYMGVFYILGGLISILPFFFFPVNSAIYYVIGLTVSVLFLVGYVKGSVAGTNKWKSGLEMSLISLSAAALGFFIGKLAAPYIAS